MKKENERLTFTVRLSEEAARLCQSGIALDDCRSRNEFVEKAIRYYSGYLSAEKNKTVMGDLIQKLVETSIKSSEKRLSQQTFRIAVELAMLQNMLAIHYQLNEEAVNDLQAYCIREVKRLNGALSLEEVAGFWKEEA